jgi:predicted DCC family thiol-disulfide oxidoreductase YuxK
VRWFLRRDRRDRLRFAPSEPPQAAGVLARHGFNSQDSPFGPNTILVVRNLDSQDESLLVRSNAVLALLAALPQPWPVVAAIVRSIPRPLRDLAYKLIAHWRYSIWGRLETCPLPTPKERERFLVSTPRDETEASEIPPEVDHSAD